MDTVALDANVNVRIRVLDSKKRVIQEIEKHNKANANLVDGILRFLKGDFNQTEFNEGNGVTPEDAISYIPTRVWFGNSGIKLEGEGEERVVREIDTTDFVYPVFIESDLHEPIDEEEYQGEIIKFTRIRQTTYGDPNNAEGLLLMTNVAPGQLVGQEIVNQQGEKEFVPYSWSYFNKNTREYETCLTEVGMFSSTGALLARVLLDGETDVVDGVPVPVRRSKTNPVIQSQSTTIVVEWKIGIVSLGHNDYFYTKVTFE